MGAMPTQFNTKDSGRCTESLTAMATHALQNDIYFLHGCVVSGDTNLPWMTLLFQCQAFEPRTYAQKQQTKTL